MATFKGNEFFCYDLSHNPIQSSTDEITLSFRTLQRNGLMLHTGKSADYVNLSLKSGAVWLVINLGSGAFEALVEPVNGKFNDNNWHDIRVTRNLRQVSCCCCYLRGFMLREVGRCVRGIEALGSKMQDTLWGENSTLGCSSQDTISQTPARGRVWSLIPPFRKRLSYPFFWGGSGNRAEERLTRVVHRLIMIKTTPPIRLTI